MHFVQADYEIFYKCKFNVNRAHGLPSTLSRVIYITKLGMSIITWTTARKPNNLAASFADFRARIDWRVAPLLNWNEALLSSLMRLKNGFKSPR